MIAWIETSGSRPYIGAVLRDREAAERCFAELPAEVRDRSAVVVREDLALPCYLAEDGSGFRALSVGEAGDYVAGLAAGGPNADGVYANLYRLDGEFRPAVPGRDEMGRLPHVHLEARDLAFVARTGVAALWGDLSGPDPAAERLRDDVFR